jgi:serine/threonine protein kinase
MTEREMFEAALEQPPERRPAYLDGICRGDTGLRQRLEALMRKNDQAGSFLESPASALVDTGAFTPSSDDAPLAATIPMEIPGTVIGPYKLLEQIGEGGMGLVFVAEQQHPVRRRVALKIIKPGMDSHQVIARFEAERQALAMMDHPNIAKVLDGGTIGKDEGRRMKDESASSSASDSSFILNPSSLRPYFVMELVNMNATYFGQ